jgi:hypothetical protein
MVVYLVDASPKMFTPATTQVRHKYSSHLIRQSGYHVYVSFYLGINFLCLHWEIKTCEVSSLSLF